MIGFKRSLLMAGLAALAAIAAHPASAQGDAAANYPNRPIRLIVGFAAGLVASLNRPGGNLTGLSNFNTSLTAKRLELLHQIVPRGDAITVLRVCPKTSSGITKFSEHEAD